MKNDVITHKELAGLSKPSTGPAKTGQGQDPVQVPVEAPTVPIEAPVRPVGVKVNGSAPIHALVTSKEIQGLKATVRDLETKIKAQEKLGNKFQEWSLRSELAQVRAKIIRAGGTVGGTV